MRTIDQMRLSCWVAAVVALALPARAAETPKAEEPPKPPRQQLKAERLVSDSAFLYVATSDLRKARSAFERTAFRGLLQEDEVSQPLVTALAKMREAFVKGDGTRSEAEMRRSSNLVDLLARATPFLEGQVALAVEGDVGPIFSTGVLPKFLLVASMPPGDDGDRWQRELEGILEKHRAAQCIDPRFKDSEERIAAYSVARVENAELGLVEAWAFVENLFLYGQGKRAVEDAIERYAVKNGAGTLALHAGYVDAYKQVGRDERSEALLYLQADARPMLKQALASYAGAQALLELVFGAKEAALEANRPHLAMGVFVGEADNAAIRERILVRRAGKEGLSFSSGACEGVTARFAPSDALALGAMQGNLADLYKWAVERTKPAKAEGAEEKEAVLTERLKTAFGVQKEAEVLGKLEYFKGEFSVSLSYVPQPNLKMDNLGDYLEVFQPVFALELDRENTVADTALRGLLQNIQKASGHEYLTTTSAGIQIFYQKGAAPREEAAGPLGLFRNLKDLSAGKTPFFVANARVDLDLEGGKQRKLLLLAENLNAIKTATRQAQAKFTRSSLLEEKKFKDLLHGFRESRNAILYLDLPRLVNVYADELPRMIRQDPQSRKSLERLPSANVLREHVFPMAWAASALPDPEGLLVECSSPMGNLPMVGVFGAIAWPTIVQKQQAAVSQEVDEKFRRLMLALNLYAANFNHFPAQLSELFPAYVKNDWGLKVFESPFKRGAVKAAQDADTPDLTNLVYVSGLTLQDLGRAVLLYEKEPTKLVTSTSEGSKLFHHVLTVDSNMSLLSGKKDYMNKSSLDRALAGKIELPGMAPEAPKQPRK